MGEPKVSSFVSALVRQRSDVRLLTVQPIVVRSFN